jgi:hypothetical protein
MQRPNDKGQVPQRPVFFPSSGNTREVIREFVTHPLY